MPRIGSFKFRAGLDYEAPNYAIIINYSRKDKKFYADLPDEVTQATGQGRVKDKDEDALTRYIRKICTEYWEAQKIMEKVIVYEYKANAVKPNPVKNMHGYAPPIWESNDISFAAFPALSLMYKVCYKLTLPDGKYKFVDENRRSAFDNFHQDHMPFMPWSQISEDFFKQFVNQLTEMAYQIHLFLDRPSEQLEQKIIESAGLLPFITPETEN